MHFFPSRFSFSRNSGLLAGLGLVLLAAGPAAAQTLTVGTQNGTGSGPVGAATVSSAGTQATGAVTFGGASGPGTKAYRAVTVYNASTFTLNAGGSISGSIFSNNTSTVTVNGGSVNGLLPNDVSTASVYGGTIGVVHLTNSSTVNIYGGGIPLFETHDTSTLNVFGTGLTETYLGYSPASGPAPAATFYALTGTLPDGTVLNAQYALVGGTLNFNGAPAVPTPPVLSSLTFPSPVSGGLVVTATVALSGVAQTDIVVGLSSSDSSVVRLHRSVIVPAGSSSASFDLGTYRSHVTKTVTITATLNGGVQTQTLTITGR